MAEFRNMSDITQSHSGCRSHNTYKALEFSHLCGFLPVVPYNTTDIHLTHFQPSTQIVTLHIVSHIHKVLPLLWIYVTGELGLASAAGRPWGSPPRNFLILFYPLSTECGWKLFWTIRAGVPLPAIKILLPKCP